MKVVGKEREKELKFSAIFNEFESKYHIPDINLIENQIEEGDFENLIDDYFAFKNLETQSKQEICSGLYHQAKRIYDIEGCQSEIDKVEELRKELEYYYLILINSPIIKNKDEFDSQLSDFFLILKQVLPAKIHNNDVVNNLLMKIHQLIKLEMYEECELLKREIISYL